ncbi:MAG: hypothetical protein V4681_01400 [Patescibacteria group bacterium]
MKKLLLLSLFGFLVSPMAAFAATPVFQVTPDPIYLDETFQITCNDLGTQGAHHYVAVVFYPEYVSAKFYESCNNIEEIFNEIFLDTPVEGTYQVVIYDDNLLEDDQSYTNLTTGAEFVSESTFVMHNSERPE